VYKRYCERTLAEWDVGAGGHCKIGQRVIAQLTYEATQPLRRAWATPKGKSVVIGVPVVALLLIGVLLSWQATLTVCAVLLGAVVMSLGVGIGRELGSRELTLRKLAEEWREPWIKGSKWDKTLVLLLSVPLLAAVLVGLVILALMRVFEMKWVRTTLYWLFVAIVATGVVGFIVILVMQGNLLDFLGVVLFLVVLFALAVGLSYGLQSLAETAHEHGRLKQLNAERAERNDEKKVAAAYERLEPFLQKTYKLVQPTATWELTYEQWVARMEGLLQSRGLAWTDMERPADYPWNLSARLTVLGVYNPDEVVLSLDYDIIDFTQDLYLWQQAQLPPRKQRQRALRDVWDFVTAWMYFAKTRVCMLVNLPPMEQVGRHNANSDA